jgi:hypothetical protein
MRLSIDMYVVLAGLLRTGSELVFDISELPKLSENDIVYSLLVSSNSIFFGDLEFT